MPAPNSEIHADLLKACLHLAENFAENHHPNPSLSPSALATFLKHPQEEIARAFAALQKEDLISESGALTDAGRRRALALARSHRLIEAYLLKQEGVPLTEIHNKAERLEHDLTPTQIEKIADSLNHPRFDPHGDPIPTRNGWLPKIKRTPLQKWHPGREGRIAHIEDEPVQDCISLLEKGIARGARIRILGEDSLWHHGITLSLPRHLWPMISVEPLSDDDEPAENCKTLAEFQHGETAKIIELDPRCTGPARHRLLDLGIVPGTLVTPDFAASFGGPVAYRIRGTCVALRKEQTTGILAKKLTPSAP